PRPSLLSPPNVQRRRWLLPWRLQEAVDDPLLLGHGHLEPDTLGVGPQLGLHLALELAQALLGPDGVQDAARAGPRGLGAAEALGEDGRQGLDLDGGASGWRDGDGGRH